MYSDLWYTSMNIFINKRAHSLFIVTLTYIDMKILHFFMAWIIDSALIPNSSTIHSRSSIETTLLYLECYVLCVENGIFDGLYSTMLCKLESGRGSGHVRVT